MVEAKYSSDDDFPDDLRVDDAFLTNMEMAEKAVRPLTKASFVMQRDSNTLADVFYDGIAAPRTCEASAT